MTCQGCGSTTSVVVRSWYENGNRVEVCDRAECGNIRPTPIPDVYFRKPYHDPNIANEQNPHGTFIESKRHKDRVLKQYGLREDGDRYHGSLFRDARAPKRELPKEFKARVRDTVRKNMKRLRKP